MIVGDAERYLNVLIKAKRMGEAAFFAKANIPSRLEQVTKQLAD